MCYRTSGNFGGSCNSKGPKKHGKFRAEGF